MPYYISPPPQNPFSRFIAGIVAVLAVAGAFMIGMAALVVVVGIGLVAGIVIWLRVAWIKRKLRKRGFSVGANRQAGSTQDEVGQGEAHQDNARGDKARQGQIIDAEYTVVSEKRDPP